ncbi:MAG: hypothetical protein ACLFP2_03040 [Candidatus Woesearchaeota archaeon]
MILENFLNADTHEFWDYGLKGISLQNPNSNYFPFQEKAEQFHFTKKTMNETRRYSE